MNDIKIDQLIELEKNRQQTYVNLIASENDAYPEVLSVLSTCLNNKYAEGVPHNRYYGGCQYVDEIESIAQERCCNLFNAEYANVQPLSGSIANLIALKALIKPGQTILSMDLSAGGHLSHGYRLHIISNLFNIEHYYVDKDTYLLDYDEIRKIALHIKPALILVGASAYTRLIDYKIFKDIANEVNAFLMVDMAHIAGLIAAKIIPSPVPYADIVTSTTHKTLRGARGAFILSKKEHQKAIEKTVLPGIQGGPFMHQIASHATLFNIALSEEYKKYQSNVIKNAQHMANLFLEHDIKLLTNGTDNHQILIDVFKNNKTGNEVEKALEEQKIIVNKNMIPFDIMPPSLTSGIRIGTPFITAQNYSPEQIKECTLKIIEIIKK